MKLWENEPNKKGWKSYGLKCAIRRNDYFGHLCGYVGVDKNHPWYGKDYQAAVKVSEEMLNRLINLEKTNLIELMLSTPDKVLMGVAIEVHGGLTYSAEGDGTYLKSGYWWFGFDCNHVNDFAPNIPRAIGETYKDLNYVTKEVKNLAKQLSEIAS